MNPQRIRTLTNMLQSQMEQPDIKPVQPVNRHTRRLKAKLERGNNGNCK